MKKITCEDAVLALKNLGYASRASVIALHLDTDSRAVATALRGAVKDGRVKLTYHKSNRGFGMYRFIRLSKQSRDK